MKNLILFLACILALIEAKGQIINLPLLIDEDTICAGSNSNITSINSQAGVSYYLRNDTNAVVTGPIVGTGGALILNSGLLNNSNTFNVYATSTGTKGLNFDGVDNKVVTSYTRPGTTGVWTVEAWIFPRKTSAGRIISSCNYNSLGSGFHSGEIMFDTEDALNNGRGLRFFAFQPFGSGFGCSASNVLTLNAWNHVAATFNNGVIILYVNGIQVAQATAPFTTIATSASLTMTIGQDRATGTGSNSLFFDGLIDDVRIWSSVRTAAQILGTKDSCLTGSIVGLSAYYNFEEGTGNIATDLVGAKNGTLTNMDILTEWVIGAPLNCGILQTLQMTPVFPVTVASITNETVSALQSNVCFGTNATINTGSSATGASYYLRDSSNNIIDGPIIGNGSPLAFNIDSVTTGMTYNVYSNLLGPVTAMTTGLDFDGTNDKVVTPYTFATAISTFTVEAWIYPRTGGGNSDTYFSNYDGNGGIAPGEFFINNYYSASNNGRSITILMGGAGTSFANFSIPNALTLNAWNHFAMVFDNGVFKIYVGGVLIYTTTASFTSLPGSAYNLIIGEDRAQGAQADYFNGKMDEVRIWTTARTVTQINDFKNKCLTGNEAGLDAYFNFDDGAGTTLTNLVNNAQNGTLVNMTPASDWVNGVNLTCTGVACELEMTQTVTIGVVQPYNLTTSSSVCNGGNYTFPDGTTQSGITNQVVHVSSFQTVGSGCDSIITTTVTALPVIENTQNITICNGDAIMVGSNIYNATGNYVDILTAANGCDSTVTTNLIVNAPIDLTLMLIGTTLTANQTGAAYQWLDCDNGNAAIAGATSVSFTPTANGNYAVEITFNNCIDTSACENVTGVGINAISDIVTNIYPNPVKDVLNIVSKAPIEQVFIYNTTGALVRTITTNLQTIPVANLPQGMYILVLQSQKGIIQHRFVKE